LEVTDRTRNSRRTRRLIALLCLLAVSAAAPVSAQDAERPDPYKDQYQKYRPPFADYDGWQKGEKEMKLSSEPKWFTLNLIDEDQRANALIEAGLKKEQESQFREALKIYQVVIEKFPDKLYRVSEWGVFVPASQYCQRRILNFPASDLAFYRTLYDARAREAFETARNQYSLLGLSDVVNSMLATSFGGRAVLELGNAALDTGHFLAALEYFQTVRDFFPDENLHTPELELKIHYCRKMLGERVSRARAESGKSKLTDKQLQRLEEVVNRSRYTKPPFHVQRVSPPDVSANDYALMPPSDDPMALEEPAWSADLPGTRLNFFVHSQPVISDDSVIYRHKNIVYSRSLLNGEMRWKNDLGGRAVWQNWHERQFPQEDVLVQDGLVFTVVNKAGPSLVALDEVTGQLRWAYGPMVAANPEQAKMRFETAPTGGPRTVYAGYVLDNIEGETHTDSEYGVIAFDSATGRVHWRQQICRLQPGKFSGGFAEQRRNRIRSFISPPLYHQGTVYYNTNAGAIVALDALSGRIKWLMRYPYYLSVHDATRQFGRGGGPVKYTRIYFTPQNPMLWFNQRPLLIGERLYLTPVDSPLLFCLNRRTGQVVWSRSRGIPRRSGRHKGRNDNASTGYLLGPLQTGNLALVYSRRSDPVQVIDPKTGAELWHSPRMFEPDTQPVMNLSAPQAGLGRPSG
jgi:outer membrane protein assembly factor BamB